MSAAGGSATVEAPPATRPLGAVVLAACAMALALGWVVAGRPSSPGAWIGVGATLIGAIVSSCVGLTVVVRARHPVGWVVLALAVAAGAGCAAGPLTDDVAGGGSLGRALLWLQSCSPIVAAVALILLALSFPSGRLAGKPAVAAAVAIVGGAIGVAGVLLRPGPIRAPLGMGSLAAVPNPTGVEAAARLAPWLLAASAISLGVAAAAGSLLLLRRAVRAQRDRRALLSVALPVAVAVATTIALAVAVASSHRVPTGWRVAAGTMAVVAAPSGLAVALVHDHVLGVWRFVGFIADYRIWTAAYALLGIASVFAATGAVIAALRLGDHPAAVAVVTLLLTIAALPVHARLQSRVDRRFGQRGTDPARELEDFVGRTERGVVDAARVRGPVFDLLRSFAPIVVVEGEAGTRLAVRTSDREIGRHAFVHGGYDLVTMRRAIDLLAEAGRSIRGLVVVDVGANVGTSTVSAIRLFGAASGVAVEPSPANLELLRLNLLMNGLEGLVKVLPIAASDEEGAALLELSDENSGDNRLRPSGPRADAPNAIEVRTRRLDDVLRDEGVEPSSVGLLWLDVQGHEGHVLSGATSLLDAGVPLVTEFAPDLLNATSGFERLCKILATYYRRAIDLRAGPGRAEVDPGGLAALDPGEPDWFTDLLLLA